MVSAVGSTSHYSITPCLPYSARLYPPVPVGGGRRQYLDHQVGRTPHILAAAQQMLAFPRDEQQVRLHDIGVG